MTKRVKCTNGVCQTETCIDSVCNIEDGNTINDSYEQDGGFVQPSGFDFDRNQTPGGGSSRQTICRGDVCQTRICRNGSCHIEQGGSISHGGFGGFNGGYWKK